MIKKELISCNLCGAKEFNVLYPDELVDVSPKVDYDFSTDTMKTNQMVKCRSCGLIYSNPMPFFENEYESTEDAIYLGTTQQRKKTYDKLMNKILEYKNKGRLLDVGCATGILLDAASTCFDVEGVELSKWAAKRASQNHTIYNRPLREINLPKNLYDIVTLMGVIEHFTEPLQEMKCIAEVLRPGGLLVLYTGDVEAWLPRVLGKKWWWFMGMHLYMFSRRTCSLLLENCGFEIIKAENHTTYFSLSSLSRSLNRYHGGRMLSPVLTLSGIRDIMVPLTLSGEMLLFARRK